MTLIFDNREALAGKSSLHAFIVGVGDLPYSDTPAIQHTFGINPVRGAARSATDLANWLIDHQGSLPCPLGTVRLSIADGSSPYWTGGPTFERFLDGLWEWREDACSSPENVTLFFFGGWGFGIKNDIALVLSDFGAPSRPIMSRTVSFDSIYLGMSPTFSGRDIATTQIYFVDAGRKYFPASDAYLSSVFQAFDIAPAGVPDLRVAPVFYSTVTGGLPYSFTDGPTLFGKALLECLNGDAAEPTDEYRSGKRIWRVSISSLSAALERKFSREVPVKQTVTLGGKVVDTAVCFVDAPKTKALLVDNRRQGVQGPGTHILIAGVSAYPHGIDGDAERADIDLGIEQLTSAAMSAYRVYSWFVESQRFSPAPLMTIRLLLSPSRDEERADPSIVDLGDRCTLQNFLAAASEWRNDASTHRDNVTILYFAGHGVQRENPDSVLLLEDFGGPGGAPLRNAVDVNNIFLGMAPSEQRSEIARTQLYFIDTCRLQPRDLDKYHHMNTTATFEIHKRGVDDRYAPIFNATSAGSTAYGVPGGQTVFSKLLLDALKTDAVNEGSVEGRKSQVLSIHSLDSALEAGMKAWKAQTDVAQEYALEGKSKDKAVFWWDIQTDDRPSD